MEIGYNSGNDLNVQNGGTSPISVFKGASNAKTNLGSELLISIHHNHPPSRGAESFWGGGTASQRSCGAGPRRDDHDVTSVMLKFKILHFHFFPLRSTPFTFQLLQ